MATAMTMSPELIEALNEAVKTRESHGERQRASLLKRAQRAPKKVAQYATMYTIAGYDRARKVVRNVGASINRVFRALRNHLVTWANAHPGIVGTLTTVGAVFLTALLWVSAYVVACVLVFAVLGLFL